MNKKYTRRAAMLFAVILLCALILPLASCSGSSSQTITAGQADGVSSVLLNSSGTKLSVKCALSEDFLGDNSRQTLYLFELPAGLGVDSLSALSPVASYRASAKYTWSEKLRDGTLTRLYCSYVLAQKDADGLFSAVGVPVPVLNPAALSSRRYDYPTALSIKGLQIDPRDGGTSDALSLGASHTVIDINIEDYIVTPDPAAASLTVQYNFNGITYHFDAAALRALDVSVKTLSDESVIVYMRFLLGTHSSKLPEKLACLGFTDADENASAFAINISNRECAGYVAALFEFFAERYTRADREYGFCGAFIIGTDANRASSSNSAGVGISASAYAALYERLLRVAHIALTSNYSGGRVYISLGNNWNESGGATTDSSASVFLANLSALAASAGDYSWGVAASAYSLDPLDSSIWDDSLATGASSQYLSPSNINVLTYALSKGYTYAGEMRNVIICSFGVNGNSADETSLDNQAASYAYAYYKTAADSDVDALIYTAVSDMSGGAESAQYGLRSTSTDGISSGAKKPIWDVFAGIDTKNDRATAEIAAAAGSELLYLYNNQSAAVKVKYTFTGEGKTLKSTDKYHTEPIFDFTAGALLNFTAATANTGIDLSPSGGMSALRIYSDDACGVIRTGLKGSAIAGADYLLVEISENSGAGTLTLRLSQTGRNGYLSYTSAASCTASDRIISFDIKDFSEYISSADINVSLWYTPEGGEPVELMISGIQSAEVTASAAAILWIILGTIAVILILLAVIAVFTRLFHRSRRRKARKNRNNSQGGTLTTRDDS